MNFDLDISMLGFQDIMNLVEVYIGYQYNKEHILYYKVDGSEEVCGLTKG